MESGETELEVRFGMELGGVPSQQFPNGIPLHAFERVSQALRESADAGYMQCLSERWELQRDLFYSTYVREAMSADGHREIVRKQLIRRVDLGAYAQSTTAAVEGDAGEVKMRFSWKTEQAIANPTATDLGQLDGVREKQRLSYQYKMWRFDLTVVKGAPCFDFQHIETALQSAETSYELELEFLPAECPLPSHPAHVAHSLLLKSQDLAALLLAAPSPRPAFALLQHHAPAQQPPREQTA